MAISCILLNGHHSHNEGRQMNREKKPEEGTIKGKNLGEILGRCVCTSCGHVDEEPHSESCLNRKCPKCGRDMVRE